LTKLTGNMLKISPKNSGIPEFLIFSNFHVNSNYILSAVFYFEFAPRKR